MHNTRTGTQSTIEALTPEPVDRLLEAMLGVVGCAGLLPLDEWELPLTPRRLVASLAWVLEEAETTLAACPDTRQARQRAAFDSRWWAALDAIEATHEGRGPEVADLPGELVDQLAALIQQAGPDHALLLAEFARDFALTFTTAEVGAAELCALETARAEPWRV